MATSVPMSHPATVVKNSDGTYTVRVQHTVEGSVTNVDFTNVLFAEVLATAYADMLNGKAALDQAFAPAVADAATDVKAMVTEAEAEAKKLISSAQTEGKILLTNAKVEAGKLKSEAQALYEDAKNEAEKLLENARAEVAELLHRTASKVDPAPAPAAPVVETKPPVVDEE